MKIPNRTSRILFVPTLLLAALACSLPGITINFADQPVPSPVPTTLVISATAPSTQRDRSPFANPDRRIAHIYARGFALAGASGRRENRATDL
jgi:hypothetical protein